MRVLVVGSGAREHALVDRVCRELEPRAVLCTPGNPGIAARCRTIPADVSNVAAVVAIAEREDATLTIVGPELPLSLGLADRLSAAGRAVFGPSAAAARLESSKAFAKEFMARHRIPTAKFQTVDNLATALSVVRSGAFGWPLVLKADGLAAGKGVVIAAELAEAETAVHAAMSERRFGSSGDRLVVEECLSGPEVSFFVIADGARALPIGTAQDHKRIFDDDQGPNTGGMGAFAPSPLMTPDLQRQVMEEIVEPVIAGMRAEGCPFVGFLYVGLMLTAAGPQVIEFNARFGDPEAQVVLPLIAEPLLPILAAAAAGRLAQDAVELSPDRLVGVVLASRGYPESWQSGQIITGIESAEREAHARVYHAGTAMMQDHLVTAGGRVLTVVGRGDRFDTAIRMAYDGVDRIRFNGMQYRRDIGRKALDS
jgi:phosphoribosylamine--glycine ligase